MRADTTTFAKSIFAQVRALGINSARSKKVAIKIASGIRYGVSFRYGQNGFKARKTIKAIRLSLNVGWGGFQNVDVIIDGEFAFSASTPSGVLVNVEATPRQQEIHEELQILRGAIRTAVGNACRTYDDAYGTPSDDGDFDRRSEYCDQDAGVIAARVPYDTLRNESLAINPFAPGYIVDPALGSCFSDYYKNEYGCRPGGYNNLADMRAFLRSLSGEPNGGDHLSDLDLGMMAA